MHPELVIPFLPAISGPVFEGVCVLVDAAPFGGPVASLMREAYTAYQGVKVVTKNVEHVLLLVQACAQVMIRSERRSDLRELLAALRSVVEELATLANKWSNGSWIEHLIRASNTQAEFAVLQGRLDSLIKVLLYESTLQRKLLITSFFFIPCAAHDAHARDSTTTRLYRRAGSSNC